MKELYKDLAKGSGFILWGDEEWNPGDIIDWSSSYDKELEAFADALVRHVASIAGDASHYVEGEGLKNVICKEMGVNPVDRFIAVVREDDQGCYIQLPAVLLNKMGWGEGTSINWKDNGDGSFILTSDA